MKTLKLTLMIIAVAVLSGSMLQGQRTLSQDVVVNIYDGIDYGPEIGTLSGTYCHHFVFKLSKDGMLESVHWNTKDFDVHNEFGDKARLIDTGHDNLGIIWDFWNNPAYYNEGWPIDYDQPDGWLDDIMPGEMPAEGAFINMSLKVLCTGNMLKWGSMAVLHLNANGEPTVDIFRSF